MSYQNLSRQLDISQAVFLARLVGVYTLTTADVASTGNYYGMKAGTNLYSFVEQVTDPETGLPIDAAPGRQTTNTFGNVAGQSLPVLTAPVAAFALATNNTLLTIPASTPSGFTNPGPYVQMRQRGSALNIVVFEFAESNGDARFAYLKVTASNSSRQITDGVLNGTAFTSATANFTLGENGSLLTGTGIPVGTTISSVTSSTAVVMSNSAPSASGVTVTINGGPAAPSLIYFGRQITDGVLNGTTTLTSAKGNFTNADRGSLLVGTGIPLGTTISSITSSTAVVMSNSAPSASGVTVTIATGMTKGFTATIDSWVAPHSPTTITQWSFSTGGSAWFLSPNSPDPANPNNVSPHNSFSLATVFDSPVQHPFLCEQVGSDAAGVPIFMWAYDPAAVYDYAGGSTVGGNNGQAQPVTVYGFPGAAAKLTLGQSVLVEGQLSDNGAASGEDVYVVPGTSATNAGVAGQPYLCDTGTDGIGNQIVNGRIVSIGDAAPTTAVLTTIPANIDCGTWV